MNGFVAEYLRAFLSGKRLYVLVGLLSYALGRFALLWYGIGGFEAVVGALIAALVVVEAAARIGWLESPFVDRPTGRPK